MTSGAGDPNAGLARIVVAAPMKSGSTYIATVLRSYFGVRNPDLTYEWAMEHALTESLVRQLRGHGFSLNLHMSPNMMNADAVRAENMRIVVPWRNVGDMIVSSDDHQRREAEAGAGIYVMSAENLARLDDQARLRFVIDGLTGWYLSFYLKWRHVGAPMYAFERMVEEPRSFFVEMIQSATGHDPLIDRLDACIALAKGKDQRFNVGTVGRSSEKFDDENKRRLEDRMLTHPDAAQLEILLWELPWDVPALAPQSPFDGQVVRSEDDVTPLFVSRGIAYPVSASWLASRTGDRRAARTVDDAAALNALPRGEPLV